ncbi:uncharacterized protein H6S33_011384 [Morchella sextelata]|uniref:uncharacterized protein n=1 Tax=Morchella sextelata TaxID=1174677 RepID=UPI001D04A12C|nr:uncharacterized protein H6S33_011384 [Morchella sextelata]KAH0610957.1 hypothetical protein H6S33_011384 [Morchella sextelata]
MTFSELIRLGGFTMRPLYIMISWLRQEYLFLIELKRSQKSPLSELNSLGLRQIYFMTREYHYPDLSFYATLKRRPVSNSQVRDGKPYGPLSLHNELLRSTLYF